MKIEVLISCMNQVDHSIIDRTNVQTDCIVINQTDVESFEEFYFFNKKGDKCRVKFVSTIERGLSRSRNMALNYAEGDICLLCDDDESLVDDYEKRVLDAYSQFPDAGIISFKINRRKSYPKSICKMNIIRILRTSSVEISINMSINRNLKIRFDELMGAGTGNGAGEENKFLMDCYKKNIPMYYIPVCIASLLDSSSSWFQGYDEKFFKNHGWASRRILGNKLSLVYIFYFIISHYNLYKNDMSLIKALISEVNGWLRRR